MEVLNEDLIENILIEVFNSKFHKTDYGREYFQGDRQNIKNEFIKIVFENGSKNTI